MKIKSLIGAVVLAASTACAPKQEASQMEKSRNGSSFETAVVLEAKTQAEGVAAQGGWIEKNLPGARPAPPPKSAAGEEVVSFGQEVIQHEGKLYSVRHLQMPDGAIRDVYFDISGYFGK